MTSPSDFQTGTHYTFIRNGERAQFLRVPDGWSDHRGVLFDDVSLADAGWKLFAAD